MAPPAMVETALSTSHKEVKPLSASNSNVENEDVTGEGFRYG